MVEFYKRLVSKPLPAGTPVYRADRVLSGTVTLESPALDVMTDLKRVKVVTITADANLDDAINRMVCAGVRMLLVVDRDDAVMGVLTSRDLSGERPVEYASRERVARESIRVGDIMTPREQMEVLCMDDVERSRVGDVVETLRLAGRQHAVVVEKAGIAGQMAIRGIFSVTRIGRQLGVEIQPTGLVQSFAELEMVMNASMLRAAAV